MKPVEITPAMKADLIGAQAVTYQAPPGEEDNVDSITGLFELAVPNRFGPDRIYLPFSPSAPEIARLMNGEPLWICVVGHRMPVIQVFIQELPGDMDVPLLGGPFDGQYVARRHVRADEGLLETITVGPENHTYSRLGGTYIYMSEPGTDSGPVES